jgi:plastocyanin domain-containing protein
MIKVFLTAKVLCLFFLIAFPPDALTQAKSFKPKTSLQKQTVILKDGAYEPANFRLKRGVPAQLTIIRKSADECGEEIVFPAYGIRRRLPLGRAIVVKFIPRKKGSFSFMCGMDMMYGKIIVQ